MRSTMIFIALCTLSLISSSVFARPIDWHGDFSVDTTLIKKFKRTDDNAIAPADDNPAIGEADGNHNSASFQNYYLKLRPSIVVNDSATFKGELSTGYGNGGRFGDSSQQSRDGTFSNAIYFYNTSSSSSNLVLRKFNMELFSDTGTYIIGRQASEWGLGAVYNDGDGARDPHATIRDGVTVKYKLGHFYIIPYWYKIDLTQGQTKNNKATEYGISLLYDNPERDLAFGILFGKKKSKSFNGFFKTDIGQNGQRNLSETDVKITDIFLRKKFGHFEVGLEAPIFNGNLGPVYEAGADAKYKANGIIIESNYEVNDRWNVGFDAGWLSGDDGKSSNFKAMYLHPNYQIANLMFRYNLDAISSPSTDNIHDSYMSNMKYAKLHAKYSIEKWDWHMAFIYAVAEETAKTGTESFNHQKNEIFTANFDQEKDYGYEIDLGFDYKWNSNITISSSLGYFIVGDYWTYTNRAETNGVENSYAGQLSATLSF